VRREPEVFLKVELTRKWLPTLDTLRNFFLLPPAEMLRVIPQLHDAVL
jgi:hypothetical protein